MAKTTTELSTMDHKMEMIERVAEEANVAVLDQMPKFSRGIALARAMNELRKLCDEEIMTNVMHLAESPLGFRTDRDGKNAPYPVTVVRDAVIECLLRGGSICGNEMNIISGKCYLTKEFYERKVRELVEELRIVEHVPQSDSRGALVPMEATWLYRGQRDGIKCMKTDVGDSRIAVRVNAGMGVDAILGKAYRKLYARIYRRVTGSAWMEHEASDEPVEEIVVEAQPQTTDTPTADEPSILDGIQHALEAIDQLLDVDAYEQRAIPLCRCEDEQVKVHEWCDWRREEIRSNRGPRNVG